MASFDRRIWTDCWQVSCISEEEPKLRDYPLRPTGVFAFLLHILAARGVITEKEYDELRTVTDYGGELALAEKVREMFDTEQERTEVGQQAQVGDLISLRESVKFADGHIAGWGTQWWVKSIDGATMRLHGVDHGAEHDWRDALINQYIIIKRAVDHSLVKVKAHPSEPENVQANPSDIIQGFQRVDGKWFEEAGLRTVLNLTGKGIDTVHNDDGSKVWIPNGQYTIVKRASTPDEPFTYYTENGVNHTIVHPSYGKEATCPSCHHSQPSDQAGEVCKRCGEAEYEAVRVTVRNSNITRIGRDLDRERLATYMGYYLGQRVKVNQKEQLGTIVDLRSGVNGYTEATVAFSPDESRRVVYMKFLTNDGIFEELVEDAPEPSTAELVAMLAKRDGVIRQTLSGDEFLKRHDAFGPREATWACVGPATILVVPGDPNERSHGNR